MLTFCFGWFWGELVPGWAIFSMVCILVSEKPKRKYISQQNLLGDINTYPVHQGWLPSSKYFTSYCLYSFHLFSKEIPMKLGGGISPSVLTQMDSNFDSSSNIMYPLKCRCHLVNMFGFGWGWFWGEAIFSSAHCGFGETNQKVHFVAKSCRGHQYLSIAQRMAA